MMMIFARLLLGWILSFNLLGNQGSFHYTPKKLNFLQGGQQQPSLTIAYMGTIDDKGALS